MRYRPLITGGMLLAFFVSMLGLTVGVHGLVNSPDEQANVLFAETFAATGVLQIEEPLNPHVNGVIGPRSMVARNEKLVPLSFLGLPVFSGVVNAVVPRAGLFLTPVLAVLAVLAWRSLIFTWFRNEALADLSAVFVAVHPAFWYYASRTMMHNVGFVSFLIFSAWMFFRERVVSHATRDVCAGVFLGIALAFRTSEAVWIGIALVVIMALSMRTKHHVARAALVGIGVLFALLPFAYLNQQTYGGPFITGYTLPAIAETSVLPSAVLDTGSITVSRSFMREITSVLFPFGIHEYATFRHVYGYAFLLYPWMTLFVFLGAAALLIKWRGIESIWKRYSMLTLFVTLWLFVMYGSWTFFDNPDPTAVSLGNSYVRYWLPIFILWSPFAAYGVLRCAKQMPERSRTVVVIGVAMVVTLFSAQRVFFGTDGIFPTRDALKTFETKRDLILTTTEEDAVIIVDRADKYLYPDRRVVVPLRDASTFAAMSVLEAAAPLYYFGITLPDIDLTYLNTVTLADSGLVVIPMLTVQEETLYRIERVNHL